MTEIIPAGDNAVAERKDDFILETHVPEVKATETEAAAADKAKEPTKTDAAKDEAEPDNDTDTGEGKKRRGGWQRKIDRLEAENAALKAAASGAKPVDPPPAKSEAATDDEPKPDDYQTWGEYTKALAEHTTKKALADAEVKRATESKQAKDAEAVKAKVEIYKGQVAEARKVYDDFDEALNDYDGPQSEELHKAIIHSDHGAEVAYYLAKNPDEAEKMRGMDKDQLHRFIGRIEAKVELGKVKEPPPVKTSKAPPPVAPVGKGKADVEPDWDSLDPDEYIRRRREQKRNR